MLSEFHFWNLNPECKVTSAYFQRSKNLQNKTSLTSTKEDTHSVVRTVFEIKIYIYIYFLNFQIFY